MKTIIHRLDHRAGYGIWFYEEKGNQKYVADPCNLTFREVPETFHLPEPTLEISDVYAQGFLQSLINSLVEQGVRSDNDRVAGELEATKKHLKDLQDIVSNLLYKLDNK